MLSRVATALPEQDDAADATSYSGGLGANGALGPSTSYNSSSGSSTSDAVMAPAVLLAEAVGRAVNARVKYLRFKHNQQMFEKEEREQRKQFNQQAQVLLQQKEQQQQPLLDGKLGSSLRHWSKRNSKEAAEYEQGQARLAAFQAIRETRKRAKDAAKQAQVRRQQ